jgi:hypothetical protein
VQKVWKEKSLGWLSSSKGFNIMTLKIDWSGRDKEFFVKVGTGGRRVVAKTSKEIIAKVKDFGVEDWKFTWTAKQQIKKEK